MKRLYTCIYQLIAFHFMCLFVAIFNNITLVTDHAHNYKYTHVHVRQQPHAHRNERTNMHIFCKHAVALVSHLSMLSLVIFLCYVDNALMFYSPDNISLTVFL